jgi:hypothetical protein
MTSSIGRPIRWAHPSLGKRSDRQAPQARLRTPTSSPSRSSTLRRGGSPTATPRQKNRARTRLRWPWARRAEGAIGKGHSVSGHVAWRRSRYDFRI